MRHLWCAVLTLAGCTAVLGIEAPSTGDGDAGAICSADIDFETDEDNCGGCEARCSTQHGAPTCTSGECTIVCATGFDDCDADPRPDGCETDLSTDPLHCGDCLNPCPTATNASATCAPGSQCGLVCKPGFDDCEASAPDCETSVSADTANCGACGHSCLGGACMASACQPFDITTNAYHPGALATDGAYVYFVRKKPAPPFDLMRVARDGMSAPELLGTVTSTTHLEVDDTHVYYNDLGKLRRVEKVPGGTSALVDSLSGDRFAVDDAFAYYCQVAPPTLAATLMKWDKTGASAAVPLHDAGLNCADVMVDTTRLYWREVDTAQMSQIRAVNKLDGTMLASYGAACNVDAAAQDDAHLYYVGACIPGDGSVLRIDKESGLSDRILPTNQTAPRLLAADGERIYAVAVSDVMSLDVLSFDKEGNDRRVLFKGPEFMFMQNDITALAQDDGAVYWSSEGTFKLIAIAK